MTPARVIVPALLLLAGCQPNPRNEITGIANAALADVVQTSPGQARCVARTIVPWRPAVEAGRYDPPPPPGFEKLYADGVFRGGGGLKGMSAGGLRVAGETRCVVLAGPVVSDDRAMIEVRQGRTGLNEWLRRTAGDWRVVMTTSSEYRR